MERSTIFYESWVNPLFLWPFSIVFCMFPHSPGVSQGADVPGRPGRDGADAGDADGADGGGSLVASREVDLGFYWQSPVRGKNRESLAIGPISIYNIYIIMYIYILYIYRLKIYIYTYMGNYIYIYPLHKTPLTIFVSIINVPSKFGKESSRPSAKVYSYCILWRGHQLAWQSRSSKSIAKLPWTPINFTDIMLYIYIRIYI